MTENRPKLVNSHLFVEAWQHAKYFDDVTSKFPSVPVKKLRSKAYELRNKGVKLKLLIGESDKARISFLKMFAEEAEVQAVAATKS